ncbi:MAG: gliding motility-associated C-terminal domain-containing protein [Bacteroidota bacterium]
MKFVYTCLFSLLFGSWLMGQVAPIIEWERAMGGSSWEEMHTLIICSDGGILVAAITQSDNDGDILEEKMGDWDYWLIKLDAQGNELWQHRYGGNKADRIWVGQETKDGGFLIGGESRSDVGNDKSEPSRGDWDFWLIKLDAKGNLLWDKTLGGSGWDAIRGDILETDDGGYLLAGVSDSDAGMDKSEDCRGLWDYWVVKLAADGEKEWDRTYGGDQRELMQAVLPMPDGGFLLGGESRSGVSGDKDDFLRGLNDYWVVRIDAQGEMLWQKTIGGNWDEAIFDMVALGNTIYLAGFSGSAMTFDKTVPSYGSIDYWVVAIDRDGNKLWDKNYGGNGQDNAYDIRINEAGNLIVAGISNSPANGSKQADSKGTVDFWVVYLTPDGEQIWDVAYGGDQRDVLTEIELLADGSIVMAGHTESIRSGDKLSEPRGLNDVWVAKTGCGLGGQLPPQVKGLCLEDTLVLAAQFDACNGCTFLWNDGSTDSIRQFAQLTEPQLLTVQAIDPNGCLNYDTIHILANPLRDVKFDLFPTDCSYQMEIGEIVGGALPHSVFLYADDYVLQGVDDFLTPGDTFRLQVNDKFGCIWDTTFQAGAAIEELIVTIGEEQVVRLGDSLTIKAQTNRAVAEVHWQPKVDCNNCLIYRSLPLEPGYVAVEVIDELGCRAQAKMNYYIDRSYDLFIPTAFSPNLDGQNDNFVIYGGEQVMEIKTFRVFDRWGRLVFERENFPPNDPNFSWNGYFNDQISPTGLYAYYAEVKFIDGRIEMFKGDFLLTN